MDNQQSSDRKKATIITEGRKAFHNRPTECPYEEGTIFYEWFMEGKRREYHDPLFSVRW
jgi:hypothetical protein